MTPKKASSKATTVNLRAICSIVDEENALLAFPPCMIETLKRMAKRIGVSTWMLMIPTTSSASFFLGPGAIVKVEDMDWICGMIHWGWVVAHSGFGKSQSHAKIDKNIQAVEALINDIIKAKVLEKLDPNLYHEGGTDFEELMANTKFVKIQLDGAVSDFDRKAVCFHGMYAIAFHCLP